jgi:hypothetical protein
MDDQNEKRTAWANPNSNLQEENFVIDVFPIPIFVSFSP